MERRRRVERGGHGFWLAGVDDLSRGAPELAAALEGAAPHEPIVLLSHHPDFFVEAAWAGVDVTLSGHTHAGQIRILGRPIAKRSYLEYHGGRFEEEGALLYVSRGAGVTGVPLRWRCAAEVPFVRLRRRV